MAGLTPNQEKFCVYYLKMGNASEAYSRANDTSKCKSSTVNRKAKEILDNGKIAARIADLQKQVADELLISEESILREFARIGFSDPRLLFREDGQFKRVVDIDDDTARAISSIKVTTRVNSDGEVETVTDVRLWHKHPALDSLAKRFGLYKKDNEQKKPDLDPLGELIKKIAERPRQLPGCLESWPPRDGNKAEHQDP